MKRTNDDEVIYFKEILVDHIRENFPKVRLSETQIAQRAKLAAYELHRDDLTTNQVMESAFSILLQGCCKNHPEIN